MGGASPFVALVAITAAAGVAWGTGALLVRVLAPSLQDSVYARRVLALLIGILVAGFLVFPAMRIGLGPGAVHLTLQWLLPVVGGTYLGIAVSQRLRRGIHRPQLEFRDLASVAVMLIALAAALSHARPPIPSVELALRADGGTARVEVTFRDSHAGTYILAAHPHSLGVELKRRITAPATGVLRFSIPLGDGLTVTLRSESGELVRKVYALPTLAELQSEEGQSR